MELAEKILEGIKTGEINVQELSASGIKVKGNNRRVNIKPISSTK